jgi:hypothetical protein
MAKEKPATAINLIILLLPLFDSLPASDLAFSQHPFQSLHRFDGIASVKLAVAQLFGHLAVPRDPFPKHRLEWIVISKLGDLNLLLVDLIKHIIEDYALYILSMPRH